VVGRKRQRVESPASYSETRHSGWSDTEPYPVLVYDPSVPKYQLDISHRRGFQLTEHIEILRVYARTMFHRQMEFLIGMLSDDANEGWVNGELPEHLY